MRIPSLLILAAVFASPALSQSERETETLPETSAPVEEPSREARLDRLFETLRAAPDESAGRVAEQDIIKLWLESGSDTVDLLMNRTLAAMEAKDYPLALDFLDRILVLKPDYAEAWNKRATIHFLLDDYSKSIADIERTLSIEPRHFGALSGLGTILREIGDEARALEAYRRAIEIDPYLDSVKEALEEIERDTAGQET